MAEKKIILGADPLGYELKEAIKNYLISEGYTVADVGTTEETKISYYDVGEHVGRLISDKKYDRGIVFCGTGMGVNIVANKFPGVYCGLCESVQTARLCRIINNCNVLSIGGLLTGKYKAIEMVKAFLQTEFSQGFSEADPAFLQEAFVHVKDIENQIVLKSK